MIYVAILDGMKSAGKKERSLFLVIVNLELYYC